MSTSIIDYIFRELAITYLGRDDLAQVKPEDLRHDTIGSQNPRSEHLAPFTAPPSSRSAGAAPAAPSPRRSLRHRCRAGRSRRSRRC